MAGRGGSQQGPVAGAANVAKQAVDNAAEAVKQVSMTKTTEVVMFSSTAIGIYDPPPRGREPTLTVPMKHSMVMTRL